MRKILLPALIAICAVCCMAAALSACSPKSNIEEPMSDYEPYGEDIDYRFSITSEEECPAGNITDDKLHSELSLKNGKTYYLVLDVTFKNFNWAGDRFQISTYLCDLSDFEATLHEAYTSDFNVATDNNFYIITTHYSTPQNRGEERIYRVVYEIKMTRSNGKLAANFEIENFGKSFTYSIGHEFEFSVNEDKCSYAVSGILNKDAQSISLPSYYGAYPVTFINEDVFDDCFLLTYISVDNQNKNYSSQDGVLYNKDKTKLIRVPESKNGIFTIPNYIFTIPSSVTSIGEKALYWCTYLENIVIPNTVTTIGAWAFSFCYNLKSITIPASVTSIAWGAFSYCQKLVEVINLSDLSIVKGEDSYGGVAEYALNVANSLEESKLTELNGYLFYEDGEIIYLLDYLGSESKLQLPADFNGKAYKIYKYAFYGNSKIFAVTIPSGITAIEDHTFYGCTNLTNVNIPDSVITIGKNAFALCFDLESISLPEKLTSIGEEAFTYCGIASISIPYDVKYIGLNVFLHCESLSSVTFENTVGWFVKSYVKDAIGVSLGDDAQNAEFFKGTYAGYYWQRYE